MSEHELRHLAVVAGAAPTTAGEAEAAVALSCDKAAQIAREAFALVPGLLAFSWLTPGIDRLLASVDGRLAERCRAAGGRVLAAAAADLGAALRLCGRSGSRPAAAPGPPDPPPGGRTLLWFQQYSGRDEIVRAAGRFLAANPGKNLADGELDAWLDTAGVPDPDLLLYAGGALEPQDVLLWQGSYAEIWHTTNPWQTFSGADLRHAVSDYHDRQRRFGR